MSLHNQMFYNNNKTFKATVVELSVALMLPSDMRVFVSNASYKNAINQQPNIKNIKPIIHYVFKCVD